MAWTERINDSILSLSVMFSISIAEICVPKMAFNLPAVSALSPKVSNLFAKSSNALVSTLAKRAAPAIP